MIVDGKLRERGERLALAAAGKVGEFSRLDEIGFLGFDEHSRRERELAGFNPEAHALGHPAPERNDATSNLLRDFGYLADTVDMRGKCRKEKLMLGARN